MPVVLVAEDDVDIRGLLVDILFDVGYAVIEAEDGNVAYQKACNEQPNIILLDLMMPGMDGFEVLTKIRENPVTNAIPVIAVSALPGAKAELPVWRLGVKHDVRKPFSADHVQLAVKVALREAEEESGEGRDEMSTVWQGSKSDPRSSDGQSNSPIETSNSQLNQIIGGGLPVGTLTLIEGVQKSGKSVLCQHIPYEALRARHSVAYFASASTTQGLANQMSSIGIDPSKALEVDRLRVYPVSRPARDEGSGDVFDQTTRRIEELPRHFKVVIVDDVTSLVTYSDDKQTVRFFSFCRELSDSGSTMIVAGASHAFDQGLLGRLRELCDAHFSLRVEKLGLTMGTTLEVRKALNAEMNMRNTASFEIQAGVGMKSVPFGKVKV